LSHPSADRVPEPLGPRTQNSQDTSGSERRQLGTRNPGKPEQKTNNGRDLVRFARSSQAWWHCKQKAAKPKGMPG